MKRTFICFMAATLLAGLFPACARDEGSGGGGEETTAAEETADGGVDMNPYTYLGPGFTYGDGILTASAMAKDNAEELFSGAFAQTIILSTPLLTAGASSAAVN